VWGTVFDMAIRENCIKTALSTTLKVYLDKSFRIKCVHLSQCHSMCWWTWRFINTALHWNETKMLPHMSNIKAAGEECMESKECWCCELQTRLMIISWKIISAHHKHVVSIALGNIFPLQITFKSSQLEFIILVNNKVNFSNTWKKFLL
jgi:hypothetical protein